MSRISYDQHSCYLNPLLAKHKSGQGITYEDLQNAMSRLEKYCSTDASQPPLVSTYVRKYVHVHVCMYTMCLL